MATILCRFAERPDIRHGEIYVVREEGSVEHGGLSSLADARADPFLRIKCAEGLPHMVQVVGGVLGGQVIPVFGLGG